MKVLVTAASRHGATDEIAERIGHELVDRGVDAEVEKVTEVDELSGYDAFVVGSAIYLGNWLKDAHRFIESHAGELAQHPTWLFASGSVVGDPPVADDPNALRPGLAERLVEATHAREHKLFGGRLEKSKLRPVERLPVRMARGREGDWRDWVAVDEWAAAIARALEDATGPGGDDAVKPDSPRE